MRLTTIVTPWLLVAVSVADMSGQSLPQRYWIEFRDKGGQSVSAVTAQQLGITERALKRRAKVLPPDRLIDEDDLPVASKYVSQLQMLGVKIHLESRWLNAVSVEATPLQLGALRSDAVVRDVRPVQILKRPPMESIHVLPLPKQQAIGTMNYGASERQLTGIHAIDLHRLGVNGTGVLLGMIDDGFNYHQSHQALQNIHVVAEHDFIHNITDTQVQPWEDPSQGAHGEGTLSSIAGFDSGNLIGAAFGVSVVLAKTEMDSSGSSDFRSEEDTYAAAVEWMERLGVDITSSSLGYKEFLPPDTSYSYASMNGHTTIVAQALSIAARKGVLAFTAMGNEGYASKGPNGQILSALGTIVSPADADSIVAVGAMTSDMKEIAVFSGTGPTADGRIKPDLVAQGMSVYWATGGTNGYWTVQGTSAATPLTAGAAALVLSAHPELTPMRLRAALLNTAIRINDGTSQSSGYPNNVYGWGAVDAYAAAVSQGFFFSNTPIVTRTDDSVTVTVWITTTTAINADSLLLFYRSPAASSFQSTHLQPTQSPGEYFVTLSGSHIDTSFVGYLHATDVAGTTRTLPYDAPSSLISLRSTPDSVRQFYPTPSTVIVPSDFVLRGNFPNPFNSSTTIRYAAPRHEQVEVAVFNLLGQRVRTLFEGTCRTGENDVTWLGATDQAGRSVSSGVYFIRLKTSSGVHTGKMVLLK